MRHKSKQQELVDIMFQIALAVKDSSILQKSSNEEVCEWIADQLKECGFDTTPVGLSWGVLKKDKE